MLAAAQGCPTVDSCVDARPFSRPRVPFLPGSVLHGSDSVGDEYAAVNSLCYSDVFDDDLPHEGEAPVHCLHSSGYLYPTLSHKRERKPTKV